MLDALNNGLLAFRNEPPARHLAQLCEVKEERWRAAIEVAFTRKFAIVVAQSIMTMLRASTTKCAGRRWDAMLAASHHQPAKALKLHK